MLLLFSRMAEQCTGVVYRFAHILAVVNQAPFTIACFLCTMYSLFSQQQINCA